MVTILLIADQNRLERLFDFTKDYPQIDLRISRSLRQGIQDISERPPALLFIQNHLSGLSGEIIVRHLLAETAAGRPRVTLFCEAGDSSVDNSLATALDVSLSDEELTSAIIGIIAGSEAADGAIEAPLAPSAEMPVDTPSAPLPSKEPEPESNLVELSGPSFISDSVATANDTSPSPPAATPFDQQLQSALEQAPQPVPLTEIEEHLAEESAGHSATARHMASPASRQPKRQASILRYRAALVGIAAAAIIGIGFFFVGSPNKPSTAPLATLPKQATVKPPPPPVPANGGPTAKATPAPGSAATLPSPPTPKAPAPTTQPATGGLTTLPAFIPRQRVDKTYAAKHPGWERYHGTRTEFRVYRTNGTIKAIQAIDRSGLGIPESFMRGSLRQMTGDDRISVTDRQQSSGFLIEKGTVTSGARVVVYRNGPQRAVRAFVVYFQ